MGKKKRLHKELTKVDYISKYLPHVSSALQEILKLDENEKARLEQHLEVVLEKSRSIKKEELQKLKQDFGPKRERVEVDIDSFEEDIEEGSEDE